MARMVGPTVVGLLSAVIPMIHFFSVDAISFLVSALFLISLGKVDPEAMASLPSSHPRGSMWDAVRSGFIAVRKRAGVSYYFVAKSITGGSWGVVMGLGIALLVREMTGEENVRDFGLAIGSYGLGNFLGALVFGNARRGPPRFAMMAGYIWLGVVFVVIGLAPTISVVLVAAAIGGFSGPMSDLGFIDMVQTRFDLGEILRVTRLRIAVETGSALFCMMISPSMIRMFGVRAVIVFCGLVWISCGLAGLAMKPAPEESVA
jgi:hypothetical protein